MALSKRSQRVLIEATRLLHIPGAWIRGNFYGRDADGAIDRTRYCALGALLQAGLSNDAGDEDALAICNALRTTIGDNHIARWNDNQSSAQAVQEAFCETVKREVTDEAHND